MKIESIEIEKMKKNWIYFEKLHLIAMFCIPSQVPSHNSCCERNNQSTEEFKRE